MSIQKMRLKRGWSQQLLADVSGLSLRTVQRIESGGPPSLETLKSLASVFETSVEDLQGTPEMTTTAPVDSASEAAALKYGRDLRKFVMHSTVYVLVCSSILAVNLWLAPDQLAAPFVWLIWGIGLAIHAAGTFVFNGVWERRQVERKLGRPL
jgi:transcriptional regulator with XRE-family HTH domain